MTKRKIGNIVATLFAIGAGLAAIWASEKMKIPDGAVDWIVLVMSGLTAGTLVFFITWGHFQDTPVVPGQAPERPG